MLVHPVPRHGHFSPRRRRGVISTSNLIYSEYGELMMLSLFNSNSNAELTQTIVATANRSTALSFRNAKSKLFFMLVAREVECDCYGALPLFLQCMSLFICQPRACSSVAQLNQTEQVSTNMSIPILGSYSHLNCSSFSKLRSVVFYCRHTAVKYFVIQLFAIASFRVNMFATGNNKLFCLEQIWYEYRYVIGFD